MSPDIDDKIEWKRKIITNGGNQLRALYRSKDTPYLPMASATLPSNVDIRVRLEFILTKFFVDGGFVGATEDWMITQTKSNLFHGHGTITPLVVDEAGLIKQVQKDIYNLLRRAADEVTIKNGVLVVEAEIVAIYSPKLTLEMVVADLERFILGAVNKFLEKPTKMKQKRRRTLKEKLGDWLWIDTSFEHYGGRMFSNVDGLKTVELKFGQTSFSILQRLGGGASTTYLVRRNHLWPMGLERYKKQFLSALPEGVKYIEMEIEEI